jgi:hypothetical protein
MTNVPIATRAIECDKLFDKLSSQLQDEEWEKRTALSKPAVETAIERYKTWADKFCALQEPSETSSLDHRVKEYSDVIDCFHSSLAELKDALEKLIAIASGERPNDMVNDDFDEDSSDDEDETVGDNPLDVYAKKRISEIPEAEKSLKTVKDAIAGLFRNWGIVPGGGELLNQSEVLEYAYTDW